MTNGDEWQTGPLPPAEHGKELVIINKDGDTIRYGTFRWRSESHWMIPHGLMAHILHDGYRWRLEDGK